MNPKPLPTYEPHPLLAWLYRRAFEHVDVENSWASRIRDADKRGTVVYVLRNLSFVDFFALDFLTKREKLPPIRFANDLGLFVLEPMGRGWLRAIERTLKRPDDAALLRDAMTQGATAALFLKRPPSLFEPGARGRIEGDAFLRTVLDVQREQPDRPILLCPQVFVWSRSPDQAGAGPVDALFGPREWPGKTRTIVQFLMNYRHVTLRAGEPIDLRDFLARHQGMSDGALIRRVTYALLRRLERERRGVIGPTQKPADRIRDEVIRSPKLQRLIRDMAGSGDAERHTITKRADAIIEELQAALDSNAIAVLDRIFDATVARVYTDLEVDAPGLETLRERAKDGSLVILPSHRSHVDYIVMARVFLQAKMPVPLVAAGDNLNFFPLGPVLRRAGAFFIRRKFKGDRLYSAVVDAYLRRLIKDGHPLEFFLEGQRSRTGKVLPPKVGLLSLVVEAALEAATKPVYFCPVSISYERTMEEESFARELAGGEKSREDVRGLLDTASLLKNRYGKISVQFGRPMTLEEIAKERGINLGPLSTVESADEAPSSGTGGRAQPTPAKRRALVTHLARRVMAEINRVTSVTAGALVATVLLCHDKRAISHADLEERCAILAGVFIREGGRFSPSLMPMTPSGATGSLRLSALREACDLFIRAGHVECYREGATLGDKKSRATPGPRTLYVVPEASRAALDISKNALVHFFFDRGVVAIALRNHRSDSDKARLDDMRERGADVFRLLANEFGHPQEHAQDHFDKGLAALIADGILVSDGESVRIVSARDLRLYAHVLRGFIESYRIAARSLRALLKGPMAPKDLVKRALAVGEPMYVEGEVGREAVAAPFIQNAFATFVSLGYVVQRDQKYELPESYASQDALATIEARIAAYSSRD